VHQGERIAVRIFEERHSGLMILHLGDQVKLDFETDVAACSVCEPRRETGSESLLAILTAFVGCVAGKSVPDAKPA
jgi:hypothetical protein